MTDSATPAAFKLEWQKQMMRDHSIPMAQRAMGAHLFNYAEGDGTRVWPGRARLSAELGISESTVDRALAALRNAGWIVRVKRGSNTGRANMADVYRLAISEVAALGTYEPAVIDDECPPGQSSTMTSAPPEPVVNRADTSRQPCVDQWSSVREPVVTDDDLPDQGPNQGPDQGSNHVAHSGAVAQIAADVSASGDAHKTDPEFVEFWAIYPLKRDRKKAYPAFVKARERTSLEDILAGAKRYRDDPGRDLTRYAEKWLNNDNWEDQPLPAKTKAKSWMDIVPGFMEAARERDTAEIIDARRDHDYIEAEFHEASEPAQFAAEPEPATPPLTVVTGNDAPDAFTAFLNAYPKQTPRSQRYAAHKAWQAAVSAHGETRVLKAAQRYTESFKNKGTDPEFAKRLSDWFTDDSFDKHLPHELEPYVGMNVEKWLDLVTERRDVKTAICYATGDTFLPQWPDDMTGWDEADVDEFRESEKERWFERHREMHLAVIRRRYGGERTAA